MGSTGEYSDNRNWAVIAFKNKLLAEEHILKATCRAKEILAKCGDWVDWDEEKDPNEFDSNMDMDYTGTTYFYYEVELK